MKHLIYQLCCRSWSYLNRILQARLQVIRTEHLDNSLKIFKFASFVHFQREFTIYYLTFVNENQLSQYLKRNKAILCLVDSINILENCLPNILLRHSSSSAINIKSNNISGIIRNISLNLKKNYRNIDKGILQQY